MNLNKKELEQEVNKLIKELGEIKLNEVLAGGVVSEIYSATLKDKNGEEKNIVVKYTRSDIPRSHIFSRTDIDNSFSKARDTHNLDVNIQRELKLSTPKIIKHFPAAKITLMKNFNKEGYQLLQNQILDNSLPLEAFSKLGQMLAKIRIKLEYVGDKFDQVENTRKQFDERFYELKTILYNGRMDIFNKIEDDFVEEHNNHLVWTDGDQKNFAVNEEGDAIFFDTGRSVKCDPDFMLPNLLGHIGLFYLAGYLDENTQPFLDCVNAFLKDYQETHDDYKLNEEKFVNYFTAGILHRGLAMRWIDPRIADKIGEDSMKDASMHFGDLIYDKKNRTKSIEKLLDRLKKIRSLALEGEYQRPKVK